MAELPAECSVEQRFFFHSFPRTPDDKDQRIDKGLKILDCICLYGLLLVPELVSWKDPTGSRAGDTAEARQRRICFTELASRQLPQHAVQFGPFALQFQIDKLRELGALPVFYVPHPKSEVPALDWAGISLLSRLADATQIVRSLVDLQRLEAKTLTATIADRDGIMKAERVFDERETTAIRDYVNFLQNAPGQPLDQVLGALESSTSMFYPTENLKYNDNLDYYRQREWRIFSGPILNGKPTTTLATEEQQAKLLEIDPAFFSKTLHYRGQGDASRASKSHFMLNVGDKHILSFAEAIVVPASAYDAARRIVDNHRLPVSVATA